MANELGLSWILNNQWAMFDQDLLTMLSIVERNHDQVDAAIKVAAAKEARGEREDALMTTGATAISGSKGAFQKEGVAIIPITGPIFRYGSMFGDVSGATSLTDIAANYIRAKEDKKIHTALFDIHSPGGEVTGIHAFSEYVRLSRANMDVKSFGSGTVGSAALWIGAAAQEIGIDATSLIGSIGVIGAMPSGPSGYEIISSQSPLKQLDPKKPAHRKILQARVDALADVFVSDMAVNRGVSKKTVLSDYGRGDVFVGKDAVKAGLADRVTSLDVMIEEAIAKHSSGFMPSGKTLANSNPKGRTYDVPNTAIENSRLVCNNVNGSKALALVPRIGRALSPNQNRSKDMSFMDKLLGRTATDEERANAAVELGLVAPPADNNGAVTAIPVGFAQLPDGTMVSLASLGLGPVVGGNPGTQLPTVVLPGAGSQAATQGASSLSGSDADELRLLRAQVAGNNQAQANAAQQAAIDFGKLKARNLLTAGAIEPSAEAAFAMAFAKLAAIGSIPGVPAGFANVSFTTINEAGVPVTGSATIAEFFSAAFEAKPTIAPTKEIVPNQANVQALFTRPKTPDPTAAGDLSDDRLARMVGQATGKSTAALVAQLNGKEGN